MKQLARTITHPLIGDVVTFVETAAETNGAYLLVEVELAPAGGNGLHYHTSFDEEFYPLEGTLGVDVEKQKLRIQPGEKAIAVKNTLHRFYNPGTTPIRFQVKIMPGQTRFIESLAIGYGLAGDGLTNKKGIPKKMDHLAICLELSDTRFTGILALLEKYLLRRAKKARKKGVYKALHEKYCLDERLS